MTPAGGCPASAMAGPQAAEGDRVGVHHPLQAGSGEAKRTLHMRQRHIDDGCVEHDHELGGRDDQQTGEVTQWLLVPASRHHGAADGGEGRRRRVTTRTAGASHDRHLCAHGVNRPRSAAVTCSWVGPPLAVRDLRRDRYGDSRSMIQPPLPPR